MISRIGSLPEGIRYEVVASCFLTHMIQSWDRMCAPADGDFSNIVLVPTQLEQSLQHYYCNPLQSVGLVALSAN